MAMGEQGLYRCTVEADGSSYEANASIEKECLVLVGERGQRREISFADVMDLRLLNYRVQVYLRAGAVVLSKLGYQTESFFERLWDAYAGRSVRALFVEGDEIMACEGDYAYTELDRQAASIARLALYPDCLCIVPHDVGARRVPLCFASEPLREGFALSLRVDTGECYRIARLGRDTEPFFQGLVEGRARTVARWQAAHHALARELERRLGDAAGSYEAFGSLGGKVAVGLFSADEQNEDAPFWFAAARGGHAAVELVCDEAAATYLYRYDVSDEAFVLRLRHAMEAVKTNRRIIYLGEDELEEKTLYRMAVDRSPHVRFLRSCNAGRIIHTGDWRRRLESFFSEG